MLNVMVTGLLCISMLLVASSCNLCLFTVKFYWNIKKKKKKKNILPFCSLLVRGNSLDKVLICRHEYRCSGGNLPR